MTVLDHGGLIVAAKDYHQSDRSANLKYSCDEGTTWNDFMYSQHDITIFGVVTEPGETTTIVRYGHVSLFLLLHFLLLHIDNHHLLLYSLYGIEYFYHIEWTVLVINFTTVFTAGRCQLDDYYWWKPWDKVCACVCVCMRIITYWYTTTTTTTTTALIY